jgi:uncharacterized protein YdiU (UPF0061 family)
VAEAQASLAGFAPRFEAAWQGGLRRKIGLATTQDGDSELVQDLLALMAEHGADFTLTFRRLCDAQAAPQSQAVQALFGNASAYDAWASRWHARLAMEPGDPASRRAAMQAVNPAYIPRNHQVEAALSAASHRGDFGPFEALLAVLARPYEERPGLERYTLPPAADERVLQTFCGT